VKGKVDICAVPHSTDYNKQVSLNVYYTWSVSSKSKNKQLAYDFICNNVTKENDLLLPLMGGIGCRRSTWVHPKINEIIPYYSQMESIHKYARTLPRTPWWHGISKIIDNMVIEIIGTQRNVEEILQEAQQKVNELTGVEK
jgi:multiple sugar transport system substrate-binding protein